MSGEPADRSDTEPDRWLALPPLGGEWRHVEGLGWQLIQDEPSAAEPESIDYEPETFSGPDLAPTPPVPSLTSGEQDHSDPWVYAGEDADPPEDVGRPADG